MPAILSKTARKRESFPGLKEKKSARLVKTGHTHTPQAGNGACRKCSCKQFVRESRFSLQSPGHGHEFIACATCGHDIRQHA